ncbi:MAG: phosphoglycerate kinase [Patescibacteria group bacterium]
MLISVADAPLLTGKRVLIRASLNVPLKDGKILEPTRILEALPTIMHVRDRGGKVILISHLSGEADASLMPVYEMLTELVPTSFVPNIFSREGKEILSEMQDGDVVLIDNIRQYAGEESADAKFTHDLAECADIFVNDDFTSAHRTHASVVLLPKLLPSFMGLQFEKEYTQLSKAFTPEHPALLIIGGAKPETKIPLAKAFVSKIDNVFLGGISANTLWNRKGYEVGTSIVSNEPIPDMKEILQAPNVVLPIDVRTKREGMSLRVKSPDRLEKDEMIVDAGPATIAHLRDLVNKAKFILWNGPLGHYELGFTESTFACAEMLTESNATTIIGGGDTVAAIAHLGLNDKFTFVSTAGGAMLDFLAEGTLPGIEALKD